MNEAENAAIAALEYSQEPERFPWDLWLPIGIAGLGVLVAALALGMLVWPTIRLRRIAGRMGVELSLWRVARLGMKGVDLSRLLSHYNKLRGAHVLDVPFRSLLDHVEAGGRVGDVVEALIHARRCGVPFDWDVLRRIDLAGERPGRVIDQAVNPWRIDVPGELLGGEALPATAGDGVELRIRGEARVVAEPGENYPLPRACAAVADLAKQIVAAVRSYRDHRDLLRHPRGLEQIIRAATHRPETGIRVMDFHVTHLSRDAAPAAGGEAAASSPAEAARDKIDSMLARHSIEHMSVSELIELAPAYLQFDDYAAARRVCELALSREPDHPRASMWLYDALHHGDAPLSEQLALAERCFEHEVQPRTAWRLIRASILCRMAVRRQDDGPVQIVDADLYRRAADELRSMHADFGDHVLERGVTEGWIDDADTAFPGMTASVSR